MKSKVSTSLDREYLRMRAERSLVHSSSFNAFQNY